MKVYLVGAGIIFIIAFVGGFLKLSNEQKVQNIKEWLKLAVVEAEKALGAGTGQLKLRYVYDLAVKQFPFMVQFVPFEVFSTWVDEALQWMNKQLQGNEKIKEYTEKE
jgi:hypothetical protein|nr:MAG TPA: holin [Caudoviricetes sp.]